MVRAKFDITRGTAYNLRSLEEIEVVEMVNRKLELSGDRLWGAKSLS